ncbi:hypothetical protein H6G89_18710 [Oscillatoria sp. FACHB-1407]|uniref:hypothetical protein n=1 Tax=Oscillatoria sp. FACHB-1407 TaxID=2692847 RepID=UPI0016883AA5|nr:hypothetical protein [Oscillatoria sp. FACHB-1407]MBD2463071.1 hypothetical protein [Oscillatoria sp. FACHB-1407]
MAEKKEEQQIPASEELSDQQLNSVAGGTSRPPSGDLNPSDLNNPTVDTSDVINPTSK